MKEKYNIDELLTTKNVETFYDISEKYDLEKEALEKSKEFEEIKKTNDNTLMKFSLIELSKKLPTRKRKMQILEGQNELYKNILGKEPKNIKEANEFYNTFRTWII